MKTLHNTLRSQSMAPTVTRLRAFKDLPPQLLKCKGDLNLNQTPLGVQSPESAPQPSSLSSVSSSLVFSESVGPPGFQPTSPISQPLQLSSKPDLDNSVNREKNQNQLGDEDDEDYDEDEMYDDEDNGEDECDEDEDGDTVINRQYGQMSSLREPPITESLLFCGDELDYEALPLEEANLASGAISYLATTAGSSLAEYRNAFNTWEQVPNPPQSVIRASLLIDQCIIKFVVCLEPLSRVTGMVDELRSSLGSLSVNFDPRMLDPSNESFRNGFWNGLGVLSDQVTVLEDELAEVLTNFNELCDWADSVLTPILAEVKFPSTEVTANSQVGEILDLHSFLCSILGKASWMIELFLTCIRKIGRSIDTFQRIFATGDDQNPEKRLDPQGLQRWAAQWEGSLLPFCESLTILGSVPKHLHNSTAGTIHAFR